MSANTADQKILDAAKSRYKLCNDALSTSREDELDDMRFMAGSPDNQWQWPADVLSTRGATAGSTINARPCITINKLPQHVKQVTNEFRQNRPSAKVIPVDDRADVDVAEILNGVVRHIEYISDADVAYDTANENQVTFGEGYLGLLTEFADETSFDQDIKVRRIRNSFSVYMDPTAQDPCGSDAQWCLITEDMLTEDFEDAYPKATPISTMFAEGVGDQGTSAWVTDKTVKVAEYFYFENEEKTLCLLDGLPGIGQGNVIKDSQEYKLAMANGARCVKERSTTIKKVKWCKINGYEVLDRRDWAGSWIPVIRMVGNEFEVDGKILISGIIRNAKDAQRMYNYWTSQEAEMLALAPKAPFIGYGGQFEGYETQWKTANTNNWPYLEVNPEVTDHDGRMVPLPQRAQPPLAQNGLMQAKMGAADDIKGTTGQYDASLGKESQEVSGRAILAREKQGDTGTYHYIDNGRKAVRFLCRQMIELIPKIYDTKRIARIIGIDGEIKHVKVDPEQREPMREVKDPETGAVIERIYNFGIGKYDVMATTGASYMTKRQETAEAMTELAKGITDPTLRLVATYYAVKNYDFPESQQFAATMKKLAPNGLLDDDDDDDTPEVAKLKHALQQQGDALKKMHETMQEMVNSVEVSRVENEEFQSDIKAYQAETQRFKEMSLLATPEKLEALIKKTMTEMLTAPSLDSQQAPKPAQPQEQLQ